jgi:anti-anti-sigma factor
MVVNLVYLGGCEPRDDPDGPARREELRALLESVNPADRVKCELYRDTGIPVYSPVGHLGMQTTQLIHTFQDNITSDPQTYNTSVVDLEKVPWTDGVGLGALVCMHVTAHNRGGIVVFVNPSPRIKNLLQVTKLDGAFTTIEPLEDGVEAVLQFRRDNGLPVPEQYALQP